MQKKTPLPNGSNRRVRASFARAAVHMAFGRHARASNRTCASAVRDTPFSRNKRSSVAFLPPTKETAYKPEVAPAELPWDPMTAGT